MALFKILNNFESGNTALPTTAVQGYCYFDKNTGKFYVDTTSADVAALGSSRLALNADKADRDSNGNTIIDTYVVGPATATTGNVAIYADGTGKTIKNTSVSIDENGNISTAGSLGLGGSLSLGSPSYGTILPTTGVVGQIFFEEDNSPSISSSDVTSWNSKSIVSFTPTLTSGTKLGTITIDGTDTDLYCNNDVKVTQTKSNGNYNFRLLMSNYTAGHSWNSGDAGTYMNDLIYANPSTGIITASGFSTTGTVTLSAINDGTSIGTNGQVLTSNGTSSYWATPVISEDTKVTQNAAITTSGSYPILLGYDTTTASAVTNSVNKTSTLTYNPNTRALTVPNLTNINYIYTINGAEIQNSEETSGLIIQDQTSEGYRTKLYYSGDSYYSRVDLNESFATIETASDGGTNPGAYVCAYTDKVNIGLQDSSGSSIEVGSTLKINDGTGVGTAGQALLSNGTKAYWGTVSSGGNGTVTSITPGNGLLNGTGSSAITTSGTLNINYGTSASAIGTASAGSANTVSRSDHVHNISLATGDANGQVKIAGTNVDVKGLGAAAYKGVTDNSASTAVTNSDTNLITARTLYYAGYTKNVGTVTSVRVQATSPVQSSVSTAQTGGLNTTISLANGYGDTKNPYASKTKNYVLAAPSTAAGAPSFRALVAADIPALDYVSKTSTSPQTMVGDLIVGRYFIAGSSTQTDQAYVQAESDAGRIGFFSGENGTGTGVMQIFAKSLAAEQGQTGGVTVLKVDATTANTVTFYPDRISIPTTAGGATKGYGTAGQVLTSDGSGVYWGSYVAKTGDTMSGDLTLSRTDGAMVIAENPTKGYSISLRANSSNGYGGLYSNGYWNGSSFSSSNKWAIFRSTDGQMHSDLKIYGAVFNDYAEYRETEGNIEPGRCIVENGNGSLKLTTERLMRGCEIVSDTFGFAIGETERCKTPTAASGRVLAYCLEGQEYAKNYIGWPVCSGPEGTVSIMTEEEEIKYPSRIIGTISEVPTYDIWHCGTNEEEKLPVNGRIWIRIR